MSEEIKTQEVQPQEAQPQDETKYARINIEGSKRKFAFLMEDGAGFGEAYDAAYSVLSHLLNAINESAGKLKPKKAEEVKK